MEKEHMMGKHNPRYRVGIDVGLNSVGLCAIEIDDSSNNPYEAMPLDFLSIMSVIHDGAIEPSGRTATDSRKGVPERKAKVKYRMSRKAVSGLARRARRLFKARHKRYQALDSLLNKYHYPAAQASEMALNMRGEDPFLSWRARISLVEGFIENESMRKLSLALAMRHIVRHRGWRNPYSSVNALKESALRASSFYMEYFRKIQRWLFENEKDLFEGVEADKDEDGKLLFSGIPAWDGDRSGEARPTIAELIKPLLEPDRNKRFRKNPPQDSPVDESVHIGKLHQSDNYYELSKIFNTQKVPPEEQEDFFEVIFRQTNPKDTGAAASLIAKDDLQPAKPRASRASLSFQRYCILTTLSNLRIKQRGKRSAPLSDDERHTLFGYLTGTGHPGAELSWHDVANELGIERGDLDGIGGQTADGSPISTKLPPYLSTEYVILSCDEHLALFKDWWKKAEPLSKEFMIELLGNTGFSESSLSDEEQKAKGAAEDLLSKLGEDALVSLEKIRLASGRAAYSVDTLEQLNRRMLDEGLDLFEARKAAFPDKNNWKPTANPLGTPTGNPAVDRVIKIVSRWLKACEREWGKPETIIVEHVREGFKSEKQKREAQSNMNDRYKANRKVREDIVKALDEKPEFGTADGKAISHVEIRRWQAIQRQNNQCLYCGKGIDITNAQMDHIVPRKGAGCSNELPNLVAVCADCNCSKSDTLFSSWATPEKLEDVVNRVSSWKWKRDSYFSSGKQFTSFKKDVIARLKQKEEDDPIDTRSIESVAWMARELRDQIAGHFGYEGVVSHTTESSDSFAMQRVQVFNGWITSEARKASGLEKCLPWIGAGGSKTRLDKRHHAVDATVIAMMRPGVAQTLIERNELHWKAQYAGAQSRKGDEKDWCSWLGADENQSVLYLSWRDGQMKRINKLLFEYMKDDRIVVSTPLRLRVGNSRAHQDTVYKLTRRRVGDALSAVAIDKAETPALWVALTRQPDYAETTGLPENRDRRIKVHDHLLSADDPIYFMATEANLNKRDDVVCAPVRNGYAKIGKMVHHARIYRIPKLDSKGKQTGWQYASLRVFQTDLTRYTRQDLFSVDLPAYAISVRSTKPELKSSLITGTAEYLGWLVVNDELLVDTENILFNSEGSNAMNKFMRAFPDCRRFLITGFSTDRKNPVITLKPRYLSAEGLPKIDWKEADANTVKAVNRIYGNHNWDEADIVKINSVIVKGCSLSVNKVLSTHPTIIRRNALGMQRWKSNNNMPVSWKIPPVD